MALSLFDKVYRELDSTQIGAEKKFVKGKQADRYNYFDIGVDEYIIKVWAPTKERLEFAEKVANFYSAPYTIEDRTYSKDLERQFCIKINTEE